MGRVPTSDCYPKVYTPAEMTESEFWKVASWRLSSINTMASSCGNPDVDLELWNKTLEEKDKGWIEGPYDPDYITELFGHDWSTIRRFLVVQGSKVRPIDDGRECHINEATATTNKLDLMTVDSLAVLARILMESIESGSFSFCLSGGETLSGTVDKAWSKQQFKMWQGRRLDLASAYKQLAIRPTDRRSVVIVVHNPINPECPALFVPNALLFGTTTAVYAFNRAATSLWYIAVMGMNLLSTNYFDDYPCIESGPLTTSSRDCMESLLMLLGWIVSEGDKSLPFTATFEVLGVDFSLTLHGIHPAFSVQNKKKRIDDLSDAITKIQADGYVSSREAAALAGKLQFAKGQVLGNVVSLAIAVLHHKAATNKLRVTLHNHELQALEVAKRSLTSGLPRKISSSDCKQPFLIFTDGSFEEDMCMVGFVALDPSAEKQFILSANVPERLILHWQRGGLSQIITQVELLAVIWAKFTLSTCLNNRRVIFFIDNEAARLGLIKGSSPSKDCMNLITSYYDIEVEYPSITWFARVPSHSNPSDAPSRGHSEQVTSYLKDVVKMPVSPPSGLVERLLA